MRCVYLETILCDTDSWQGWSETSFSSCVYFLLWCFSPASILHEEMMSHKNRSVSHSEVQWEVIDDYFLAICNCHSIRFVFVSLLLWSATLSPPLPPPNLTGNIFNVMLVWSQASTLLLLNSLGSHVSVCKTPFLTCLHQSSQVHVDVTICKLRMNSIASVFFTLTEIILLFFFLSGFVAWHWQILLLFFVIFLCFMFLHCFTWTRGIWLPLKHLNKKCGGCCANFM